MKIDTKYPEEIMCCLRQCRNLDASDTSQDDLINEYSPDKAFSDVCIWNGLLGAYDLYIKEWVKDIYGVELGSEE